MSYNTRLKLIRARENQVSKVQMAIGDIIDSYGFYFNYSVQYHQLERNIDIRLYPLNTIEQSVCRLIMRDFKIRCTKNQTGKTELKAEW